MIDVFDESNLERLAEMQGAPCISIYIPAHEAGMEVNGNMDKLAFKNELQKVVQLLEGCGYKNSEIDNLVGPAKELMDDPGFWKEQSLGLAVFIGNNFFEHYRLPISFQNFSGISSRFILSPIIPAIQMKQKFFILSINKYAFKLFQCTMAEISEMELEEPLRHKIDEALAPFDYKNNLEESVEDMSTSITERKRKKTVLRAKEKGDLNLIEFFRLANEIVMMKLKGEEGPLVVAAVDEWQGDYRKVNTYKNSWEKGYIHNGEFLPTRQFHSEVLAMLQPYFQRSQDTAMRRYQALAGTGQTSDEIDAIILNATAGRVESLFVEKNRFVWGRFDDVKKTTLIEEKPIIYNYCLLNYASAYVLKNNAKVYILDADKMPSDSPIAAVYRY